ncbi:MAG: hypothetical protein GF401_11150 [Chitinivibrionales bacterium]|nr:hypothetical protein [Chitinivibrionales bacterium]
MKKPLALILFAFLLSCFNFPTRFERIVNDELRPVTAVFSPYSEAAPGDTLSVKIHFAGNPVIAVDTMMVSYSVLNNVYGINDTFTNVEAVQMIDSTMALPESVEISFVVPDTKLDDLLAPFVARTDSALRAIDPALAEMVPPNILIEQLTNPDPAFWDAIPDSFINTMIAPALEYITKPAYFFITARSHNGIVLESRAEFVVRFNTNFKDIPKLSQAIQVNNNPEVRWMGVYKVEGDNVFSFDPLEFTGEYEFFCFFNEADQSCTFDSVILIDTGYSYFIAADSGIVQTDAGLDTTRDAYIQKVNGKDTIVLEEYFFQWFYENLDESTLPQDSLFILERFDQDPIARIYPPLDTQMRHFKVWVAVYDEFFGEFSRPRGMTLRQIEGVLEYTDAYKNQVALK